MRPFFAYLLRCGDGTYYAGHTDDLAARLLQHQTAEMGYTSTRKPVELVWQGEFESREGALAYEQRIKGWSRAKKEALIAGDWERLQDLALSTVARGLRQAQPERSGAQPERSGAQPERSGAQPEQRGTRSEQRGTRSEQGGVRSEQGRARLEQGGVQAEQGGALPAPGGIWPERRGASSEPEVARIDPTPIGRPEPSSPLGVDSVEGFVQRIVSGVSVVQRRAIAKAITLVESTRSDHRAEADELLTALLPHTGKSFRLGLSGVPGVGKSTFIEVLGLYLIGLGHRVAVLTIDPSSTVSGGSILGDKTRMERLSVHERAYIRPSPSSGTLGGVADKTREAMLVCEAAGYDVVIVETVGVGQSETAVANMTDMFVLMQLPNAGDDLQAIKKGVMELADLVVINKADIDPDAATRARAHISSSLRLLGQHGQAHAEDIWRPQVLQLSALKGEGVGSFWSAVTHFRELQTANGQLPARRTQQAKAWMWERIEAGLKQRFRHHAQVQSVLEATTQQVLAGSLPASTAARQLLSAYESNPALSGSKGSGRTET